MRNHLLTSVRAAGFRLPRAKSSVLRVGAVTAVLLLSAACESDGMKNFACKSAGGMNNLFGTSTSAEQAEDCGGTVGQTARATKGSSASQGLQPLTDRSSVTDVQARLNDLGYDAGPADGQMGPRTRSAIRAYQKDAGIKVDGVPSKQLLSHLRKNG